MKGGKMNKYMQKIWEARGGIFVVTAFFFVCILWAVIFSSAVQKDRGFVKVSSVVRHGETYEINLENPPIILSPDNRVLLLNNFMYWPNLECHDNCPFDSKLVINVTVAEPEERRGFYAVTAKGAISILRVGKKFQPGSSTIGDLSQEETYAVYDKASQVLKSFKKLENEFTKQRDF